ncbi:MAG: DNA mismatch repair endonuclease MutL [Clostridia bacterium]|nr:DNA mismatch repair endonuclease MutL [Clostridia bacterium]
MGKIVILDENTANKIAAGEVVERPSSVVKEMVENSIDAGSSSISVEIKNGGVSYIKVTDNGSGIDDDDVEIAFERHATSKIRKADDLESIATMGFRGEALASIASVSTVELTTRVQKNPHGTYIKIQGGAVKDVRQIGCPVGTTFVVRNLFFNTPARFKFLKKDSTEAGYISDAISRIALGNPQISFKLTSNNTTIVHTPGNNDLLSTIFSIYGKDTARGVNEINYADNKIKITGYAGKPEIARATRTQQSIYINKRYIKSKIISSAIDEAYKTFLLKNKFPFIILNLEINPLLVDVNVHPAKMEVRFSEEQDIFRSVYHAVSNALMGRPLFNPVQLKDRDKNPFKFKGDEASKPVYTQQNLNNVGTSFVRDTFKKENILVNREEPAVEIYNDLKNKKQQDKENNIGKIENVQPVATSQAKIVTGMVTKPITINLPQLTSEDEGVKLPMLKVEEFKQADSQKEEVVAVKEEVKEVEKKVIKEAESYYGQEEANKGEAENLFENTKVIGQAFSTYILLQHNDELMLIDQHAAHERIMYEQIKNKYSNNESLSQYLIAPVVVELTHQELKLLDERKEFFNKMGFVYDEFGNNSVILRAVPSLIDDTSIREVFMEVIDSILNSGKSDYSIIADETLYTIACKAAVKANKRLSEIEIKGIMDELSKMENPYTCPHGRPTIVRISKYELEKKFKRIV